MDRSLEETFQSFGPGLLRQNFGVRKLGLDGELVVCEQTWKANNYKVAGILAN
jgi:hypothetical protein